MEYRYALEIGKPIIAFLHKNPENIISKYVDATDIGKTKLQAFRDLTKNKDGKILDVIQVILVV